MAARLLAGPCVCARVFVQLWVHTLNPIAPSTISSTTWHNRGKGCLLRIDLHTFDCQIIVEKQLIAQYA